MSDGTVAAPLAVSPVVRATRMYVAPVERSAGAVPVPLLFDPARQGRFPVDAPPAGWYSLGAVLDVEREDLSEFAEVWIGAPAELGSRGRSRSAATLRCTFAAWSKLAMALGSGSQQMNLLRVATTAALADSGGTPDSTGVMTGSTAAVLVVRPDFVVSVGDLIAVDNDYSGTSAGGTGFVGSPFAGAYVSDPARVNNDPHYLRRLTFNLGRVSQVVKSGVSQVLTLDAPLPAGDPSGAMQVSVVEGFQDRVGGSYLSEWSALLVMDGVAGDRVLLHYPRLQVAPGATESRSALAAGLERVRPCATFTALPVTDANDGDRVLCFRSYLPAPGRAL